MLSSPETIIWIIIGIMVAFLIFSFFYRITTGESSNAGCKMALNTYFNIVGEHINNFICDAAVPF